MAFSVCSLIRLPKFPNAVPARIYANIAGLIFFISEDRFFMPSVFKTAMDIIGTIIIFVQKQKLLLLNVMGCSAKSFGIMPPRPPLKNNSVQRKKPVRVSFVPLLDISNGTRTAIILEITDISSYMEKASPRKKVSNQNGMITLPAPPKTDIYTRLILLKASMLSKTAAIHTKAYINANINVAVLSGTNPFERQKKYIAAIGWAMSIYRFKDVLIPLVAIV